MNTLLAIFRIPELSWKLTFTLVCLAIYRIGYFLPLPMVDQASMRDAMTAQSGGAAGQALGLVSMFSGGNLSQACIFSLGIMPYISASIILQLLGSTWEPLKRLQKEGESGRKRINEWTRLLTVPICVIQAYFVVRYLANTSDQGGLGLFIPGYATTWYDSFFFVTSAVLTLTAGTLFLMWLGEQIDEYGIGNGISLIIMAGIIARIPDAVSSMMLDNSREGTYLLHNFLGYDWIPLPRFKESVYTLGGAGGGSDITFEKLLVLSFLFIGVVVAIIALTRAQRRIPTQSARHVRGRRMYGGNRDFLPLRVNQAGVMPIIFASSLLLLPMFGLRFLADWLQMSSFTLFAGALERGYLHNITYILLIFFFSFFWVEIVFNPKEVSDNLKSHSTFIPGHRPGKWTEDYLEKVLLRITFVGAAFLALIAILPNILASEMDVDWRIASFFGGTSLLIAVSVILDLIQKIDSHLVMRKHPGLTEE